MINVSDLYNTIRSLLDDDRSGRYTFDKDVKPALNMSVNYVTGLFERAYESRRITAEAFTDLLRVKTYALTAQGTSVSIDVSNEVNSMWAIVGLDPLVTNSGNPDYNYTDTQYKWAKKLSIDEWGENIENPFKAGSSILKAPGLTDFGYIMAWGSQYDDDPLKRILMLRPASMFTDSSDRIALWYLNYPTVVTDLADTLEFPLKLSNFLVQQTLKYLSTQQGARQSLYQVTDKAVAEFIQILQ
jgi:hypothetical protein